MPRRILYAVDIVKTERTPIQLDLCPNRVLSAANIVNAERRAEFTSAMLRGCKYRKTICFR